MSVDIGAVKGLIELQDDFSSRIDLAGVALSKFTKENQESLLAVAGAAGIVAAAVGAVGAAVIALGIRGSDINDLRGTIEQFTGGAREADEVMEGLRSGTMGVVDNFTLAERAAHLLSAGVKLTADEFGTLGSAAFVMANRGLGSVEENLKLVSDAMVTGKTRALSLALGVIDAGDAEDNYAKSLGVTKEQLSDTGKAEAHRIAVMGILSKAVSDAGEQTRDFGEQLAAAQVFVTNWVDDLGSAIAASPVFAAGMKAMGDAISEAFGEDSEDSIKTVVSSVEQGAIIVVDFGLAVVEMARVVNVAWSAVQTVVLGTETIVIGFVDLVVKSLGAIAEAGEGLNILPEGTADKIHEVDVQISAMTVSLAKQTAEAAKGMIGQSEFDATLDKVGGSLFRVRDAMVEASNATRENSDTVDIAASNAQKLAKVQGEIAKSMIDRVKVQQELDKIEKKSLEETAALWADHAALVIKSSGTSGDFQRAQIEATFQKAVIKLDELDPAYKKHYAALRAVADESLTQVGDGWDTVKDKSIEGMRQQAEKARELYNKMSSSSLHFTRDDLEEQLRKTRELEDAARGMGNSYTESFTAAATAAQILADKQEAINEKLAEERELRRTASVTTSINPLTQTQFENLGGTGRVTSGSGSNQGAIWSKLRQLEDLEGTYAPKSADSYFAMIKDQILLSQLRMWAADKERPPGFAQGGMVDIKVGELGPEAVRVPLGTQVFPTWTEPTSRGNTVTLIFNVNGTAEESAQKIKKILMKDYASNRQLSFAG